MTNHDSSFQQMIYTLTDSLIRRRNLLFEYILVIALLGFEMFNYSTTQYALNDLLGDMRFAGFRWATILAIAFCGIDFAGIARLFSDDEIDGKSHEVWYLFIAWFLAATLNATLTWWGVSMALVNHAMLSSMVIDPGTLMKVVPIFVAIWVWVTRILVISSISSSVSKYFARFQLEELSYPQAHPQSFYKTVQSPRPIPHAAKHSPATARASASQSTSPQWHRLSLHQKGSADMPEKEIIEPEYIPDPGYSPILPAYHSLSDKGSSQFQSAKK